MSCFYLPKSGIEIGRKSHPLSGLSPHFRAQVLLFLSSPPCLSIHLPLFPFPFFLLLFSNLNALSPFPPRVDYPVKSSGELLLRVNIAQ